MGTVQPQKSSSRGEEFKREERADDVVPEDGGATNRGTGESRGGAVGTWERGRAN